MTTNDTPALETERLFLRRVRPPDFDAWAEFHQSDRARYVGGRQDFGRAWRTFAGLLGHWEMRGFGPLAMESKVDGVFVGLLTPWYPGNWPEKELGWLVWEAYEGKGLVREAALRVREHVYRDLGWTTAVSYIDPANTRSRRLAERLGAREDPAAERPEGSNCVVYRHPAPDEL